ncbi:MAG: type II toxin-antitoxin system HicA family toxin [Ktedonobacterales bacterium]
MKVREAIKIIEDDGWYLVTIRGDLRQYKHPTKSGKVTVSGALGKDVPPGTLASIFRQAQLPKPQEMNCMYRYLVIIEQGATSYGAYVPDLPGCVAVGDTRAEVERALSVRRWRCTCKPCWTTTTPSRLPPQTRSTSKCRYRTRSLDWTLSDLTSS